MMVHTILCSATSVGHDYMEHCSEPGRGLGLVALVPNGWPVGVQPQMKPPLMGGLAEKCVPSLSVRVASNVCSAAH